MRRLPNKALLMAAVAAVALGLLAPQPHHPFATPTPAPAAGEATIDVPDPTAPKLTAAEAKVRARTAATPPGRPRLRALKRHVKPACLGNGYDGYRVRVLYVRDSGTRSRLATLRPTIRSLVANVDDTFVLSARRYGMTQQVRWVTGAGCAPTVTEVVLPKGTLASGNWARFRKAMIAKGWKSRYRKYLVFADTRKGCGTGDLVVDSSPDPKANGNNGRIPMFARINAPCWQPGTSTSGDAVSHELMHTLGAVVRTAPHRSAAGHCTDGTDLMCYKDGPKVRMKKVCSGQPLFDCRGDDYYHPKPRKGSYLATHWNTARSYFLTPAKALR